MTFLRLSLYLCPAGFALTLFLGHLQDITQQHLCDPLTVSLIEKCARFHIHCAHHLCQEPMMSFDAKINNENLTKCLQSLKEMYQDLASKNIYCPHEAEFRQYSVLLKLNDGDILRWAAGRPAVGVPCHLGTTPADVFPSAPTGRCSSSGQSSETPRR